MSGTSQSGLLTEQAIMYSIVSLVLQKAFINIGKGTGESHK